MKTEQIKVINAVHALLHEGKIPFKKIESLVESYSSIINDKIEKEKEDRRRFEIAEAMGRINSCKDHIDHINCDIENTNNRIAECKAKLKALKNKEEDSFDYENDIKSLLWWIFNNENSLEKLRVELKTEEDLLRKLEEQNNIVGKIL